MKVKIELDLKHNGIMDFGDIQFEILECIRKLRYRHLVEKTISIEEIK